MLNHLRIGTFNLLAPCYNRLRFADQPTQMDPSKVMIQKLDNETCNQLYTFLESVTPSRYKTRNMELLSNVISKMQCDVMCFQEFWMTNEMKNIFENFLMKERQLFHSSYYAKRTRGKEDGVAIFVNEKNFHVEASKEIVFHDVGDRVGLMLHLKHKQPVALTKSPQIIKQHLNPAKDTASKVFGDQNQASKLPNDIIVVNTHLTFPHNNFDENYLRPEQIQKITTFIKKYLVDLYSDHKEMKGDEGPHVNTADCGYGGACTVSQLNSVQAPKLPVTFNCFIAGDMNTRLFPQCPMINLKHPKNASDSSKSTTTGESNSSCNSPYFTSYPHSSPNAETDLVLKHLEEEGFSSCFQSYFGHHNFVSHHNHLDEEVGADFIFHGCYTIEEVASSHPTVSALGYDYNEGVILPGGKEIRVVKGHKPSPKTTAEKIVEKKFIPSDVFLPKNVTTTCSCTKIENGESIQKTCICSTKNDDSPIKVVNACLLPCTDDEYDFPKEFLYLSDHRPFFVDVELKS